MENIEVMKDMESVEFKSSVLVEFHKIDLTTGKRLDVVLIDVANEVVPNDCKEGWGEGLSNPIWDLKNEQWVEGDSIDDILPHYINEQISFLNSECQRNIYKGFEFNGDYFQFNEIDQSNFNQQLTLLLIDEDTDSIVWKTENNGVKVFSREEFIAIVKFSEIHKRTCITRYWQLKGLLTSTNFNSIEEVLSIEF